VTPQKAPPAAPPSPAKRARSLALPRMLQRAAALSKLKAGTTDGPDSEQQPSAQVPPVAEGGGADMAARSDASIAGQAQEAVASQADATAMDASEERAEAAAAEAPEQTGQDEQALEGEEPAAKRARSEPVATQQDTPMAAEEDAKEGDLGEDEPEIDPRYDEEQQEDSGEALAPCVTAVAEGLTPSPVNNGARRMVVRPADAGSLRDGVALGGEGGMVLPVAGFGTYKLKKGEAKEPVLQALRAGYRLVDTAQVYENEADVGLALRESGIPRGEVVLETKVWRSSHGYDRTMKAFKQSLKKLGVDYIDLYLIHWPGAKTGWPLPRGTICPPEWTPALRDEGTWRAMEDLYLAGKVKAIGVANYSIRHLQQLLKACRVKPMVNQVEFHPRLVQTKMLDFCREQGIQVQAYASLGSSDAGQAATFFAFPPVQAAAKAHQVTPAQVLLRWALEKGAVIVPKSCKEERIQENAQLFNFALTESEVAAIDKLNQNKRFSWKGLDSDTIE